MKITSSIAIFFSFIIIASNCTYADAKLPALLNSDVAEKTISSQSNHEQKLWTKIINFFSSNKSGNKVRATIKSDKLPATTNATETPLEPKSVVPQNAKINNDNIKLVVPSLSPSSSAEEVKQNNSTAKISQSDTLNLNPSSKNDTVPVATNELVATNTKMVSNKGNDSELPTTKPKDNINQINKINNLRERNSVESQQNNHEYVVNQQNRTSKEKLIEQEISDLLASEEVPFSGVNKNVAKTNKQSILGNVTSWFKGSSSLPVEELLITQQQPRVIDKARNLSQADLKPEQIKFIDDEVAMLSLQDDVEEGELTFEGKLSNADFYQYLRYFRKDQEFIMNKLSREVSKIDQFIAYATIDDEVNVDIDAILNQGFAAIRNNDLEGLRAIIDNNNYLVSITNDEGDSLLHQAVRCGNYAITKLLIMRGIKVNSKNHAGLRPIDIASKKQDKKMLGLLAH